MQQYSTVHVAQKSPDHFCGKGHDLLCPAAPIIQEVVRLLSKLRHKCSRGLQIKSGQGWFATKMSRSVSLPTIAKPSTKAKGRTEERNTTRLSRPVIPTVQELVARQSLKNVSLWFRSWRTWQQRIFVCRVMEHCSRRQLHVLATALEPVLHIGFSSSLAPHLASLHVDGAATFQVQRGIMQRTFSDHLFDSKASGAYLPSLPTTLLTSESASSSSNKRCSETTAQENGDPGTRFGAAKKCTERKEERVTLPSVLPLTHAKHAPLSPESSVEDVLALRHTRFSSVPDFRSTTDLLQCVKRKELFRPRQHTRSRSLGTYLHTESKLGHNRRQREGEQFKTQLKTVSQVPVRVSTCGSYMYIYIYSFLTVDAGMVCKAAVSAVAGNSQTLH